MITNVPNHLAVHPFSWNRSEIAAIRTGNLRAAHFKGLTIPQHAVNALDQRAIARLLKDDHIASFDLSGRKGKASSQDIIALAKIRPQARTAHL